MFWKRSSCSWHGTDSRKWLPGTRSVRLRFCITHSTRRRARRRFRAARIVAAKRIAYFRCSSALPSESSNGNGGQQDNTAAGRLTRWGIWVFA
jgi:hypothetical protein